MARRRWILGLAFAACVSGVSGACSSFESADPDPVVPPRIDASLDDGPSSDAAMDATAKVDADADAGCDRTKPFTMVHKVDGVNTAASESHARLSPDERVVYFQRGPAAGGIPVILRAERPTTASAFGASVPVQGLPGDSRQPFASPDELTLYFVGFNGVQFDPLVARRDDASAPFQAAKKLPLVVANVNHTTPVLRADERELLFAAVSVGVTTFKLWHAFPFGDGGYVDSGPIDDVNSNKSDHDPVMSADGLDLYFSSERNSVKPKIWMAHRDSLPEKFRTAIAIEEITPDAGYVAPSSVSADNCRLYFYSDQDPSAANDIYVAERAR
jgi:hypothetical protein